MFAARRHHVDTKGINLQPRGVVGGAKTWGSTRGDRLRHPTWGSPAIGHAARVACGLRPFGRKLRPSNRARERAHDHPELGAPGHRAPIQLSRSADRIGMTLLVPSCVSRPLAAVVVLGALAA